MLITSGTDLRRIESKPALSISDDAITWSDPIDPFGQLGNAVGIASGSGTTIVLNDRGMVAHSSDLSNWSTVVIADGYFSPRAIDHGVIGLSDPIWMMVGQKKFSMPDGPYGELDEAGQIFRNTTGAADDWELIYSDGPSSILYGVRYLDIGGVDAWVAVGSDGSGATAVYSLDSGMIWQKIALPGRFRSAYDATVSNGKLWITVDSAVLSVDASQALSTNAPWDSSPILRSEFGNGDLVKIAANGIGQLVAACSAGLYITSDLTSWNLFSVPGYRFRSCYWDAENQIWLAGADSQLMSSTLWTSRDARSWSASNNMVQAFDFQSI